jgi:hypothetical protein
MQFPKIDKINIPNKIMHTLQKSCIVPNNNSICTNNFSTVDNKKPGHSNLIIVNIFIEYKTPKRVLHMNLGITRLRGRPRNRWQDGVRDDGRIVGGEGWQEKVHNREEWKKLLRTARNRRILHMPME